MPQRGRGVAVVEQPGGQVVTTDRAVWCPRDRVLPQRATILPDSRLLIGQERQRDEHDAEPAVNAMPPNRVRAARARSEATPPPRIRAHPQLAR